MPRDPSLFTSARARSAGRAVRAAGSASGFRRGLLALLLLPLALAGGCASSGNGGDAAVRGAADLMELEEIQYWEERGVRDMMQLVELARPRWLRAPSGQRSVYGSSSAVIAVFRDNRYLGGTGELRDMPLVGLRQLRWLNAAEADALPGTGNMHVHGAIMIITTASGGE